MVLLGFVCVVDIQDFFNVLTTVIDLVVDARIRQGAVRAQRLERAATDVECLHHILIVEPILQAVYKPSLVVITRSG